MHSTTLLNLRAGLAAGLVIALGMLAGCASGPVSPDLPVTQSEYKLGHGDRLLVNIYGQPELTGEHVIDGSGNVTIPLVGTLPAGGGTTADLEGRIVDKLQPKYFNDPKVTVQVVSYRPFYIIGEVKDPGDFPYVEGMVVMNAVARAKGFTYRAREDEFYITRASDPERLQRMAGPNTLVMPGDLVTVRERYF